MATPLRLLAIPMRPTLSLLAAALLAGCAGPRPVATPTLTPQASGTDALLIAADAVSDRVVWAAGTGGTVSRTTDGGAAWTAQVVPGADTLQFRDVHAFSATSALVLSIGPGAASRVFRTDDAGATWTTGFVNTEPDAFYDGFAFFDADHGLLFSDSVDGVFRIQSTDDGGRSWTPVPADRLPPAADGEGGFASSGTLVMTDGRQTAWIATGNAAPARVLRTTDRGATWTAVEAPVAGGEAAGLTSIAVLGRGRLVAVGGPLGDPAARVDAVALSDDGGTSWRVGGRLPFAGAAYGAAAVPGTQAVVAVGPGGVALSRDAGATWMPLSDVTHWGLTMAPSGRIGWLVGPDGRITQVRFDG